MAANTDLIRAFGADLIAAARHYAFTGHTEGRVTTFDASAYLAANPDLQAAFGGNLALATQHYVLAGYYEIEQGLRADFVDTDREIFLSAAPETLVGTVQNDTFVADSNTLSPGDIIDGLGQPAGSMDEFNYYTSTSASESAIEIDNVERLQATVDNGSAASFDLSGSSGIDVLSSFNSTGDVAFNQVTELAAVEIQNVTERGDVTVQFQNAAVAGATTVNLALMNNYNDGAGIVTIGSVADANSGVETLSVATSLAASTVQQLNVDMTTLNISGNQNLVITDALNGTERTINAGGLAANLTLASTNTGSAAVTFTGAQGVDTVTFAGTTGNHTINSGNGNDVITLGLGDDTVNLGAGNDTLNVGTAGITVLDLINGGTGYDEIVLTGADDLSHSEVEGISSIEEFTMTQTGTKLLLLNNLLTNLEGGEFTVNMGVGGNEVDMTEVSFSNTNRVTINGSAGDDLVIADDATVNAKAELNFGDGYNTLQIMNGAVITSDDMTNISGLDRIVLTSEFTTPQTWRIDANPASYVDLLTIWVDDIVPQGSVLYINNSSLLEVVVVYANSNISVIPTGNVIVRSTLEFTENQDNLIGTDGKDLFSASSLDQVDTADNADGNGDSDTLTLGFAVNNINNALENLLNDANIHEIETLVFEPSSLVVKDVAFEANKAGQDTTGGDFDFDTFVTSIGDDTIEFLGEDGGRQVYTFTGNEGDDTAIDNPGEAGGNTIHFNGGADNDLFHFMTNAAWGGGDRYAPGAGIDGILLNNGIGVAAGTIAEGDIATLVTDGALEYVTVDSTSLIDVRVNDADLHDFTGGVAVFNLHNDEADDAFLSAHTVAVASETVLVNAWTGGYTLLVGGAGDDVFNAHSGLYSGGPLAAGLTADAATEAGIAGLRGGDTINLYNDTTHNVIYKTPHDGAMEGHSGTAQGAAGDQAQDWINGFKSGRDKIVFAYSAAKATAVYDAVGDFGAGNIGDVLDAQGATAGTVNARENILVIDLNGGGDDDELVLYSGTGLTDAALLDLSGAAGSVADYIAQSSTILGESVADVLIFAVHGTTDTAIYSYTAQNTDGEVNSNELALLGVVNNEHLVMTDFIYA